MSPSKVSVIVPVFNGERFIGEALGSLQREQEIDAEIIVVDDGSVDGSVSIVRALADNNPRIRLVAGGHRGVSVTRNIGVRAATGDYITFLDCDDLCAPGRITRQLDKLNSFPEVVAVIGETLWFEALTPDLNPVPGTRHERMTGVNLHSALFRRSVFDNYGFFDENLTFCEDIDFFLRLLEGGARFLIETEVASFYRRHPGNMTKNIQQLRKAMMRALQKSIARRRAAGRTEPFNVFFLRRFSTETIFSSQGCEAVNAAGARPSSNQADVLQRGSPDV